MKNEEIIFSVERYYEYCIWLGVVVNRKGGVIICLGEYKGRREITYSI